MKFGNNYRPQGVMDSIFGGTPISGTPSSGGSAPAPAPAAPAPAPAPTATPAAPASSPAAPSSPLDAFKDFWNNPVDADGKPITTVDPLAQPVFTLDPVKIAESAKNLDFTKELSPDLVAKVAAGGQEGTAALMELLNQVQQKSFVAAITSAGNMVNQGLLKQGQSVKSALPTHIRSAQLADLPVENPALNHPAVQPLVSTLRQVQAQKNPNASPADIAKTVDQLLAGLMQAMVESTPEAQTKKEQVKKAATDWDAWMGS